jgi:hypothetical protein
VVVLTPKQIEEYLKARCPEHVWRGGREGLVQGWKDFVEEVERGYCPRCLIEEYWNDLDTRELIHDIGCDGEVEDLDKRFAAMLTATEIKHWHTDRDSDYDFWNYGYPKNAAGFFLEEVKRHVLTLTAARKRNIP